MIQTVCFKYDQTANMFKEKSGSVVPKSLWTKESSIGLSENENLETCSALQERFFGAKAN